MELSEKLLEQFKKDFASAKTYNDLMGKTGAIKKLMKASLEGMLEAELTEHLGYSKHSQTGNNSGNSRNGRFSKTVKTDNGAIALEIPRDRNGEFEPIIVKKHESRLGAIEDKIISMYSKGMSTRDIQSHIEEIYGLEISPTLVSQITDKVTDLAAQWQNRPLEGIYPVVFLDAIHFKVKDEDSRKVVSKASYTCLGINIDGQKDLLGIWIGEAEGAAFWLSVITELKNRGIKEICIACIDGLTGFSDAIKTVFPEIKIQRCIVHQIRNSMKYVASKDKKVFAQALRTIYTSPTEAAALQNLKTVDETWGKKYTLAMKSWRANWEELSTFFEYPQEIRTMIYTTNGVEALHRQLRKVTKSKSIFPNDEALTKMLFLAYRDIVKKWTMPVRDWAMVISHFSIIFDKQVGPFLSSS
ncbi:MAG: IS256 family transposase [Alphaproteobacteria bacterium]|nr:IS256 family transposase [Alphaproteobacteria bacterium]